MTIRSYYSISMPELPLEIPYMVLNHLDLPSLVTIERVCKTLFEISITNNTAWHNVANKKKIPIDTSSPPRTQVLYSTINYCTAARIIFPKNLVNLPFIKNAAYERIFIDKVLADLDKTTIDPILPIKNFLKSGQSRFGFFDLNNPLEKAPMLIPRIDAMTKLCIAFFQVGIETGNPIIFDNDFLDYLKESDFSYGTNMIMKLFEKSHTEKAISKNYSATNRDRVLDFINKMDKVNNAALPFIHYLFQLQNNPSPDMFVPYLKSCAYSELLKALAPIKVALYEKRAIHVPLLKNLSGSDWVKTFEEFMINEGVDLSLKIQYPNQLKAIINTFDEKTRDECIKAMLLEISPSCCAREYYILNQINTSIQKSIRAI